LFLNSESMKAPVFLFAAIFLMAGCIKNSPPETTTTQTALTEPGKSNTPSKSNDLTTTTYVVVDSIAKVQWNDSTGFSNYTFTPVNFLTIPDSDIVTVAISQTYSPTNPSYAIWSALPVVNYLSTGDQFSFKFSQYQVKITYTYPTQPTNPWLYFKITVIPPP
jgi:hypothetical protein